MNPDTHFEQMFDHLPDYRGVRSLVFIALMKAMMTGIGPVGKEWICREINYSDKPVAQALVWMQDRGIAVSTGRTNSWQLSRGAYQLPLMAPQLAEGPESSRNNSDSIVIDMEPSRKVSDSPKGEEEKFEEKTAKNVVKEQSSRKLSDSIEDLACLASSSSLTNLDSRIENLATTRPAVESEKFRLAGIAETLDEFEVKDPSRAKILAMPDLSPEFVRAHLEHCETTGQAIYRIQHRWDTKRYKTAPPGPEEIQYPSFNVQEFDPAEEGDPAAPVDEGEAELARIWSVVVFELQHELSPGVLTVYVQPARLVDRQENRFTIGYPEEKPRAWAESRLASTIRKILVGFLNDPDVELEFILFPDPGGPHGT